jgi:hypothetical protein
MTEQRPVKKRRKRRKRVTETAVETAERVATEADKAEEKAERPVMTGAELQDLEDTNDQLLIELRRGQQRWARVDALHELLAEVLRGEKDMPLITLTVRLPDGSSGKLDIDIAQWPEEEKENFVMAFLGGISEQWVAELGGFISDGAKLYRNYRPRG